MSEDRPVSVRLDSWKEIAGYLNRDVRTVIRWEREKALPVHRVPGGKRKAVFAYAAEIDAWLASGRANGNHANGGHANGNHRNGKYGGAPATEAGMEDDLPELSETVHVSQSGSHPTARRAFPIDQWKMVVVTACLLGMAWIARAVFVHSPRPEAIRPFTINQLTDDHRGKTNLHTDGTTLYFNEMEGARFFLASAPVSGSPIHIIDTPFSNVALQDLSKDGTTLLFTSYEGIMMEGPLWTIPVHGGTPRRVGDMKCEIARWSPDNRRIACASRTDIILMDADGSNERTIGSFPSLLSQIIWSPHGDKLRYILYDSTAHTFSQWEIGINESETPARRLAMGASCCWDWNWTRDGKTFLYTKLDASGRSRLMLKAKGSAASELPIKIGNLWSVAPDRTGKALYLLISDSFRGELLKFDSRQRVLEKFLPGISAAFVSFSPDGKWITYAKTQDNSLWRSKADGSDALELVKPPLQVEVSSWSPDGRRIAFMEQAPGKPWRIYLIGRDGGPAREASQGTDNQGGPSWSPDGKSIVYGNVECDTTQSCWIRRLTVATGKTEILPGSNGLRTARWSPNGKYIAALRFQTRELMLFDVGRQRWRVLADSVGGDNINWSRDSQYVYVDSPRDKKPVVEKIRVTDGHRSTVVTLDSLQKVSGQMGSWIGLTPGDSPILSHIFTSSEVYRLDWTDR